MRQLTAAHRQRSLMVLFLLLGAALRLSGLNNGSPPGLEHDEVANWLIDQGILAGQHGVYFTAAYGHEAGFHYWQTLFVGLLGDNALALRLPAAFAGLLLLAVSYALARRLFGGRTALLHVALLATLFYPVFYSRLGLRAISLPLVAGLALYCFWRGLQAPAPRANRWLAVAGLLAGLALYTYLAARALPFFFAAYLVYLAIWHRPLLKQKLPGLILFALLFALVAWPLWQFLRLNPGAETRVDEVRAPLDALLAGDLRPMLLNSWRILLGFGWRGDPLWRQNVAPQPIFDPITALFFYAGLGLALWRWRDARYGLLLLWLSTAIVPSIVTIDAPSNIRMSNSLLLLTLFPALVMHNLPRLSPALSKLSTDPRLIMLILLIGINTVRTGWYTFKVWPDNEEIQFVWQAALTEAAAFLDAQPAWQDAAIGGWTPETMDSPTMALTLRRDDVQLRHFQPERAVILPAGAPTAHILQPTALPLAAPLQAVLEAQGLQTTVFDSFLWQEMPLTEPLQPAVPADLLLGGELRWLGYWPGPGCAADGICELVTLWQVETIATGPRRLFLHQLDQADEILAQDDGLAAPAVFWQPGDLVLQLLQLPAQSGDRLRLGVYDPDSGIRLRDPAGADAILLTLP
ncbi:MAG: glycosyltransferase family 39 protein [Anaerolineales bacterium]|nr:glycosyltransferase family 39 protein [Anaerolineales bacterium]